MSATANPATASPVIIDKTDHPVHFSISSLERRAAVVSPLAAAAANILRPIDTYGWDTVFAIKLPDVNTAIAKAPPNTIPTAYDQTKSYGQLTYRAQGGFANWRLAPGGDGTTVRVAIDLTSGTLTQSQAGQPDQSFTYSGGTATLNVDLSFIPRPGAGVGPLPTTLQVAKPVSTVTVSFPPPPATQPNPLVSALLPDILNDWFLANLTAFQYVFATVILNNVIDKAEWKWLLPTSVAYAYKQSGIFAPDDQCILGVLCNTSGNDSSTLSAAIDPKVIPDGSRAGFVISSGSYYTNLLLKHLPDAFDNASSPDFQVRPNSDGTSSVTTVNTTYMHCSDKYKFDISPGNFTVTIGAGNMVTEITRAHYNVSPGIDLYLDYKIKTKCTVVTRSDGTQALMLQDDGNIETSHTIEKSAGVTITEIVLGAIAGAIFAGIGEMGGQLVTKALVNANKIAAKSITAQVVKVIVSVFIGILAFGIIVNISNFIIATADQDANKLPPFDPFVKAAVQNVNWPDATAAQVTSVRFNNGMQIGLDPKFAE